MQRFSYPVTLTEDKDGGYVVTFKDVPEAITQGETIPDSLEQAADALEEALVGRIRLGEEIPAPSKAAKDQYTITPPILTAAKAALYTAIRESGLSQVQLAAELGCDEKEVRRMLDPYHSSKLPRIEEALAALGKRLLVTVEK